MYKICFYNPSHIGDIFFIEPFIRNFCNNNNTITFYVWLLYGYYLYNDIENLVSLDKYEDTYNNMFSSGDAPERHTKLDSNLYNLFMSNTNLNHFLFTHNSERYIAINLWCKALGCNEDVIPTELNTNFYNTIHYINHYIPQTPLIQYINNLVIPRNIIPKLPLVEEFTFANWKLTNTKKLCFFYNYVPRSFTYTINCNEVINQLACLYKNYVFIVPKYHESLSLIENVKFCDKDFNCIETPDCKNIVVIEKITQSCDIIITIPTGSSWLFFNTNIASQTNKKYILSSPLYADKLNDWFNYSLSSRRSTKSNETIITNIEVNNMKDIFE